MDDLPPLSDDPVVLKRLVAFYVERAKVASDELADRSRKIREMELNFKKVKAGYCQDRNLRFVLDLDWRDQEALEDYLEEFHQWMEDNERL